jgi:hypothetical protein
MRSSFAVLVAVVMAVAIAACGSSPTGSATPGATLAPGATATAAGATLPPTPGTATPTPGSGATNPPVAGTGHECDAFPTFDVNNPDMSPAPDEALAAKFPAAIDGQPASDMTTGSWLASMCALGQSFFDSIAPDMSTGLNWAAMSIGHATYSVDDEDVTITAFRTPGQDASGIVQGLIQMAAASGGTIEGTLSQGNVAGKNVFIVTDSDGSKTYGYVSGDTLFFTETLTDSQAAKIIGALP